MPARYVIQVGTMESARWLSGDREARRLAARYARWMFPKYARAMHEKHPGTMADAICNAWDDQPIMVNVYRTPVDGAGVIMCVPAIKVGSFEVEAAPEWCRKG
jgi:hypothetical protein